MADWTRADTAKLLAVIATYDDRNFGDESHMLSWTNAGHYGRWDLALAVESVHKHHITTTELIKPAHVNMYVQSAKNDRAMRHAADRANTKALGTMTEFIEAKWRSDEEMALTLIEVPCPFEGCRAPASLPCVIGGRTRGGRNKRHMPHPGRHVWLAEAARQAGLDPSSTCEIECGSCGAPAGYRCMNLGRGAYLSSQVNGGIHPMREKEATS